MWFAGKESVRDQKNVSRLSACGGGVVVVGERGGARWAWFKGKAQVGLDRGMLIA